MKLARAIGIVLDYCHLIMSVGYGDDDLSEACEILQSHADSIRNKNARSRSRRAEHNDIALNPEKYFKEINEVK